MKHIVLSLACLTTVATATPPHGLTAEKWLNGLTIRQEDPRTYVVLFFDTARPQSREEHRALQDEVERLNKLARRTDVLVVGVTPQREAVARQFVERYKPRFAIGVQCGSHRSFGVTRFPAVVVVKGESRQSFDAWSVDEWEALEELLGPEPEGATRPLEELSTEELQDRIEKRGYPSNSLLDILRIRMDPEAFLAYCDELERKAAPGTWLGDLNYQRHLADANVPVKQPPTTPAIDAIRKAQREGTRKTSEWRQLLSTKETWSDEEILDLYTQHSGDGPEDLVYRADLATALESTKNPQYAYALLDMLEAEPDAGIRLKIINAISGVYDDNPAAFEPAVVERLQAHLAREENVRWAKSRLEALLKDIETVSPQPGTPP